MLEERTTRVGSATTKSPDLPLIAQVVSNDYGGLFQSQIEERNLFKYPPFYRLIYVYLKHRKGEVLDQAADLMAGVFKKRDLVVVCWDPTVLQCRVYRLYLLKRL